MSRRFNPSHLIVPSLQFVAYGLATVQSAYLLRIETAPHIWWGAGVVIGAVVAIFTYLIDRWQFNERDSLWKAIYTLRLHSSRKPKKISNIIDIPEDGDLVLGLLMESNDQWDLVANISSKDLERTFYPNYDSGQSNIEGLRYLDDTVTFLLKRYEAEADHQRLRLVRLSIVGDVVRHFSKRYWVDRVEIGAWLRSRVAHTKYNSLTRRFLEGIAGALDLEDSREIVGTFEELSGWMAKSHPANIKDLLGDKGPLVLSPRETLAQNANRSWIDAMQDACSEIPQFDPSVNLRSLHEDERCSINLWQDIDKLNSARDLAEKLMPSGRHSEETEKPIDIVPVIALLPGIISSSSLTATRRGDAHGAHYELNGLDELCFELTGSGALSAFFCLQELPVVGAFWHGAYGRDYQFLFGESLRDVLREQFRLSANEEVAREALAWSGGPHVEIAKGGQGYVVSWISYSPTEGLVVRKVLLNNEGKAMVYEGQSIIKNDVTVYY